MNAVTEPTHEMLARLSAVRRRIRRLLAMEATGRLLACAAAYVLVVAAADWWVHFPGYVRLIFGLTFVACAARFAYRNVYLPATAPIHLEQLALALGQLPAELRDRVAASVGYLDHGGAGSAALWQEMIRQTAGTLLHERLQTGVRGDRAGRWAALGLATLLACGGLFVLQRELASVGFSRVAAPLGDSRWPRRVEIEALTGDALVAVGESYEVAMRVRRGYNPLHRAYLSFHLPDGRVQREVLRASADGAYRRLIENIRGDLRYSFSYGDEDLGDRPFMLRVALRPEVVAVSAAVTLPAYAGEVEPEVLSAEEGAIRAIEGGAVALRVRSNKPIDTTASGGGMAAAVFEDGRRVPLLGSDDSTELTATFEAAASGQFGIELTDQLGLASRDSRRYSLDVRPDGPPAARIVQPGSLLDVTPRAEVIVVVTGEDDVGLASLNLVATRPDGSLWHVADLLGDDDGPASPHSAGGPQVGEPRVGAPRLAERAFGWSLSTSGLSAGDVVTYWAEASDAYVSRGVRRAATRTASMRLNVVSSGEYARRLRDELQSIRRSLQRLAGDLAAIEEQGRRLESAAGAGAALSDADVRRARRLTGELERLSGAAGVIVDRLEALAERGFANRLGHEETVQQSRWAATELSEARLGPLKGAAEAMEAAAQSADAALQAGAVSRSVEEIGQVHAAVRTILDRLARWSDYAALVGRVRELLDRQESLMRVVGDMVRGIVAGGIEAGGMMAPGADGGDRSALAPAGRDQKQLSVDASRVLVGMKQAADTGADDLQPRGEALAAAADAGYRHNVPGRMEEAASEIAAGHLGLAGDAQAAAAAGLRAMLAVLEEQPRRELARLTRELADATDRLKKIIAAQGDLIARCELAAGEGFGRPLATRQSTLARTTGAFATGLKSQEAEWATAREEVRRAAGEMEQAAEALSAEDKAASLPRQQAALSALQAALAMLERWRQQADEALAEKSLAALTEQLVEIHRQQAAIRGETAALSQQSADPERFSRADLLRLARLEQRQQGLREPMDEVRAKLSTSVVYAHVCARLTERMDESARLLGQRALGTALGVQDRILTELARLIGAVEDLPRPDPTRQFADSSGAGQSAAQPTMERLIPPLAELKVLRSMQADLHRQTMELEQTPAASGEAVVERNRRVSAAAAGQQEIHELATRLVEQAAEAAGGTGAAETGGEP